MPLYIVPRDCPHCFQSMSGTEEICPHCGRRTYEERSWYVYLVGAIIALSLFFGLGEPAALIDTFGHLVELFRPSD